MITKKLGILLKKSKDIEAMAGYLVDHGDWKQATKLMEENRLWSQAEQIYVSQNEWEQAAEMNIRLSHWEQAGVMFGKAGLFDRATDCLEKAYGLVNQQKVVATDASAIQSWNKERRRIMGWLSNLYIKLQKFQLAGEGFEQLGDFEAAAKCYGRAKCYIQSATMWVKIKNYEEAEKIIGFAKNKKSIDFNIAFGEINKYNGRVEEAGDAYMLGEMYLEAGSQFMQAGKSLKAAEAFHKAESWEEAACNYRDGGEKEKAAFLFERIGLVQEAAELLDSMGQNDKAAELYERGGMFGRAGILLALSGDNKRALNLLQRTTPYDPYYEEAKERMYQILMDLGHHSMLVDRLRQEYGEVKISQENLGGFYLWGLSFMKLGEMKRAVEVFERILSIDYDFRDVKAQLQQCQEAVRTKNFEVATSEVILSPEKIETNQIIAGRYQVLSEIGKGGMGMIFRVRDKELDMEVAMKVLRSSDSTTFEGFKTELKLARQITHPNVIKVFDIGRYFDMPYFTMEFVPGDSLQNWVKKDERSLQEVIYVFLQIIEGVGAAHKMGILHRDLKPFNVLVGEKRKVKLLDFGIAKKESGGEQQSLTGSPKYMSPEQIRNEPLDRRTDVYSLGIVLYFMLARREPFTGKTAKDILLKHIRSPLPDMDLFNPEVPKWLNQMVEKCCSKDRTKRFGTVEEIKQVIMSHLMPTKGR